MFSSTRDRDGESRSAPAVEGSSDLQPLTEAGNEQDVASSSPRTRRVTRSRTTGRDNPWVAESEQERLNRELIELLNELRVVLPGVQVLFAFLLTIPFARGFPKLDDLDRDVYFVSLLLTTLAIILLITPSAYHRIVWRHHDKVDLLSISNKITIAGMAVLAIALTCSLFMISDFIFATAIAGAVTAATAVAFAGMWFLLPYLSLKRTLAKRG
jgi:hypothetical protein